MLLPRKFQCILSQRKFGLDFVLPYLIAPVLSWEPDFNPIWTGLFVDLKDWEAILAPS